MKEGEATGFFNRSTSTSKKKMKNRPSKKKIYIFFEKLHSPRRSSSGELRGLPPRHRARRVLLRRRDLQRRVLEPHRRERRRRRREHDGRVGASPPSHVRGHERRRRGRQLPAVDVVDAGDPGDGVQRLLYRGGLEPAGGALAQDVEQVAHQRARRQDDQDGEDEGHDRVREPQRGPPPDQRSRDGDADGLDRVPEDVDERAADVDR